MIHIEIESVRRDHLIGRDAVAEHEQSSRLSPDAMARIERLAALLKRSNTVSPVEATVMPERLN
jgi:hypothetical protein